VKALDGNERSCDFERVSKGQDTKSAILDEAVGIASRVGFNALSIGQLAESTGMSKSGLFAHFKSKEALQLETLHRAQERFNDLVIRPALSAPRGRKRVEVLFDRWLDWETEALTGGCIFVTATIEFDDQPGPMRDAVVRCQQDWLEFVATVTGTAVAEGDFRADLDTEQFAFQLQGLMLGYHHAGRLMRDPKAREHTRQALDALLAAAAA
jgi:AcrR family transcriptional regulator